ncbi:MAG: ATPase [Bacteroidales bacterium]|nr:ATPase [Bacteroidales bacterium]
MDGAILIAECGATKCDWCLASVSGERRFRTPGLNAAFLSREAASDLMASVALSVHSAYSDTFPAICPDEVHHIWFYGAGLTAGTGEIMMRELFSAHFPDAELHFESDLMAACRALLGHEAGIAGILGTGSNSCLYDGTSFTRTVYSGGFILGDEGSGAVAGRMLLSDYLKHELPSSLEKAFNERYGLNYQTIVRKVYSEPSPSRWLASLALFLADNREDDYVRNLLRNNFSAYIGRQLLKYDVEKYSVSIAGSFGYEFRDMIAELGERKGIRFRRFLASPLDALVEYHLAP